MAKKEAPRLGRTRAAASGSVYAGKLDKPEHKPDRRRLQRSLYRRRPAVACMVKVAILRCGGRVR